MLSKPWAFVGFNDLIIFSFPTIFVTVSPDARIGGTEGIYKVIRKVIQNDLIRISKWTFGLVHLSSKTLPFFNIDHFCISCKVITHSRTLLFSAKMVASWSFLWSSFVVFNLCFSLELICFVIHGGSLQLHCLFWLEYSCEIYLITFC